MWDALHAVNTADTGQSYGVYARTYSPLGRGVYGYASADFGLAYGVYGRSNSTDGAGVYAQGINAGPDLILAGNEDTHPGDDGKIYSDRNYTSSDIYLVANDNLRIDLNEDNAGDSDSDFEIYNGDNTLIFGVDESGAVTFGGTGFPPPAYDSGWLEMDAATCETLPHGLGGDVEKYVVDTTFRKPSDTSVGISNSGIGGDNNGATARGGSWQKLTTTTIDVCRWYADVATEQIRVRIWVYP
jgi:hypothetical protein